MNNRVQFAEDVGLEEDDVEMAALSQRHNFVNDAMDMIYYEAEDAADDPEVLDFDQTIIEGQIPFIFTDPFRHCDYEVTGEHMDKEELLIANMKTRHPELKEEIQQSRHFLEFQEQGIFKLMTDDDEQIKFTVDNNKDGTINRMYMRAYGVFNRIIWIGSWPNSASNICEKGDLIVHLNNSDTHQIKYSYANIDILRQGKDPCLIWEESNVSDVLTDDEKSINVGELHPNIKFCYIIDRNLYPFLSLQHGDWQQYNFNIALKSAIDTKPYVTKKKVVVTSFMRACIELDRATIYNSSLSSELATPVADNTTGSLLKHIIMTYVDKIRYRTRDILVNIGQFHLVYLCGQECPGAWLSSLLLSQDPRSPMPSYTGESWAPVGSLRGFNHNYRSQKNVYESLHSAKETLRRINISITMAELLRGVIRSHNLLQTAVTLSLEDVLRLHQSGDKYIQFSFVPACTLESWLISIVCNLAYYVNPLAVNDAMTILQPDIDNYCMQLKTKTELPCPVLNTIGIHLKPSHDTIQTLIKNENALREKFVERIIECHAENKTLPTVTSYFDKD